MDKKIIDIHTHGIGGYDTRTSDEKHILKIAEIQGNYGVSAIIPAIYPAPINKMRENMLSVKKAMDIQKSDPGSQLPGKSKPARIIGIHLEGPFINPLKSGALDPDSFIEPTEYNLMSLIDGFEDVIKIITIAPELNGALKLIRKIADIGIIASMGHSDAAYEHALAGYNAGAKGITHLFNAMRGFHHREPGLAGFGLIHKDIYIEIIADQFHLHPKTIEMIFRIKNHNRIIIVSDAVKESMTPAIKDTGITDDYGKLLGGCITITESLKILIENGIVSEDIAIKCISENPERYLSLR